MCHNYRTKANRILKANASKEHCLAKTVEDLDQLWGKRMGLILISSFLYCMHVSNRMHLICITLLYVTCAKY